MKIIIPMAGQGKRLRPHTLTIPKPLLPIAGKSIVQRLAGELRMQCGKNVEEIAFVTGRFGKETEDTLLKIAADLGAKGKIFYQDEPQGTAHAIWQAKESMDSELIVAFADTLFQADFALPGDCDGVIWVKEVVKPESFGVVTVDNSGFITGMVEKPKHFVSNLAIIGIYYFRNGPAIRTAISHILENNIRTGGEYQLTDALELMRKQGSKFFAGKVSEWMDCGNKDAVLETHRKTLEIDRQRGLQVTPSNLKLENSIVIPPCFFGDNVTISRSVVGPYVSAGNNTVIRNAVVKESLIRDGVLIDSIVIENSILGNGSQAGKWPENINLGDYSSIEP